VNNIYIIHPFPIIRKGLSFYIQNEYKSVSVNEFSKLEDVNLKNIAQNDILIINIQKITVEILNILTKLQNKGIKIIIWMDSLDEMQIRSLFQKGFSGYFLEEVEEDELIEGLEKVHNNTPYLHTKLSSLLFIEYLTEIQKGRESKDSVLTRESKLQYSILTNREWEVLNYLSKGYSNEKIAKELFLTESTVKNHVSAILRKLEVPDRTAAVVLAIKNEWIKYASIS
jgi:two-component system, NarL family, response regulator DegU